MKSISLLLATLSVLLLSACGGSGSSGDDAPAAVLAISPASIELFAQSEAAATLTVTNTSTRIAATAISALLPSSWTDVVQDASGCASLPPQAHCTLSFTPGNASHPQASVNISGHNTETASAVIVVSPPNGAVISPLTATTVSLEVGQSVMMMVQNNSATVTATNIAARLAGTVLAGNVIQDASGCIAVPPGASCSLSFAAGNTPVSATSFAIQGDNTSTIGGSIAITLPTSAQLGVAGSPLVLQATAGTPVAGTMTITNQSTLLTATNIGADFTGTALDGNVALDASACMTLAPQASCVLTFTPGSTAVPQTAFTIQGDNTSQAGASIAIDAPQSILSVSGSPLTLIASGIAGTLILTNTSSDTAENIVVNFTGTALDGNVTQTGLLCQSLPPSASCSLEFTPGPTVVAQTSFAIAGSNTNTVTAAMTIKALAVGDSYAGGIVLVLPSGGTPGLIVAASEVSLTWGGFGTATGALSVSDGAANTATIVGQLGFNGPSYAAVYCDAFSESAGGVAYDDWYLPAYNELGVLIAADSSPGFGIFSGTYWSSSELNANTAYAQTTAPTGLMLNKSAVHGVRCIRAFTL